MPLVVAALSWAAAGLLSLGAMLGTATGVGELRATGYGADGLGSSSGHGDHASAHTVVAYEWGRRMRKGVAVVVAAVAVLGLVVSVARGWSIAGGVCVAVLIGVMVVTAPMGGRRRP